MHWMEAHTAWGREVTKLQMEIQCLRNSFRSELSGLEDRIRKLEYDLQKSKAQKG
jgi:hypothetical protein